MTLPAAGAGDRYRSTGAVRGAGSYFAARARAQQQTSCPSLLLSIDGRDRQTDRRTDERAGGRADGYRTVR